MGMTFLILAGLLVLSLIPLSWLSLRAYLRARPRQVVTCPETGCTAAVQVDGKHAAATTFVGEPELRLASCSHWPERAGCSQGCLTQVESGLPVERIAATSVS